MASITHRDRGVNRPRAAALPAATSVAEGDARRVSEQLAAANRLLLARRAQAEAESAAIAARRPPALPAHLGWHSPAVSACLRHPADAVTEPCVAVGADSAESTPTPTPAAPITLRVFPTLLHALARKQHLAAGRVWLLCRHLDQAGRGWLPLATVRAELAGATPLRVGGRRRLRQILQAGDGLFWQRDADGRLWLAGAARVAAGLGVARLGGRPVALPLDAVTGSAALFRAHCYASVHSSRTRAGRAGNPISRQTVARLTGIPARTQRAYDRLVGVEKTACVALLPAHTPREAGWQHGSALFTFCDRRGQHGPAGKSYRARQLPNRYRVPHHHRAPLGRQRAINRQLKDLVTTPAQGNRGQAIVRRYSPDPAAQAGAAQAGAETYYWSPPSAGSAVQVWYGCQGSRRK